MNPAVEFLKSYNPSKHMPLETFLEAYAQFLLNSSSTNRFPVRINRIYSHFGVAIKYNPRIKQRGLISQDKGKITVVINSTDRSQTQNFTKAHELVEILANCLSDPSFDAPCLKEKDILDLTDKSKEKWCEIGAAYIHFPTPHFANAVNRGDFSLIFAQYLSRQSNLSLTAVIRAMIDLNQHDCALIYWKLANKPSEFVPSSVGQMTIWGDTTSMDPPKELRIEKYYKSPTSAQFIRENKSVNIDSTIGRTFEATAGTVSCGYDFLEITNESGCYRVEAVKSAFADVERVMSLIYFDDTRAAPQDHC